MSLCHDIALLQYGKALGDSREKVCARKLPSFNGEYFIRGDFRPALEEDYLSGVFL